MQRPSLGSNIERLLVSVKRLEGGLRSAGLPPVLARLPVCWLAWHYCAMIDGKTARISRIGGRLRRWLAAMRRIDGKPAARTELIDLDQSMWRDLEATRLALWELRGICLDVCQLFSRIGYASARLQRKQDAFLRAVDTALALIHALQQAMTEHDSTALVLLRQMEAGPLPLPLADAAVPS